MSTMRVRINTTSIDAMFATGGEIGRTARLDAERVKLNSIRTAPRGGARSPAERPGQIKLSDPAGYSIRYVPNPLGRTFSWYVRNKSGHAVFVHEGTTGPIRPIRRGLLRVHLPGRTIRAVSVRGQSAQPWIKKARDTYIVRKYGGR
jgi:hypothetical protein